MQQQGIIDHRLPPARAATPYSRWGDWTLLALVGFLAAVLLAGARQRAANTFAMF
jgi:apolipoprotein N-acyltransferase